jgi:hypothetical protein
MDHASPEQVRALRAFAQHLSVKAPRNGILDVVRSLCGVNAQFKPAMMLSLRARIEGLEIADVEKALQDRALVRAWAMRGTVHLLAPADLLWLVSLIGPSVIAKGARRRAELGLDEEKLAGCLKEIPAIFSGGSALSRDELVDRLIRGGVRIDRAGQGPYHLAAYAGLKGLIYIGPDRPDGDQTYRLVEPSVGEQKHLSGDQALAELTRRYLKGYGPADLKDLSAWSGLSATYARKGWELASRDDEPCELKSGDHTLRMIGAQLRIMDKVMQEDTAVNLVPAFDTYVLGYSSREYIVPEQYRPEIYHGGQTVPAVLVNGLAAGTWRYERRGKKLDVKIRPFKPFDEAIERLIQEEVDDIGRFFGIPASLSYI